jgi:predicted regulator of Ras-like GTPase activity (Roadblock/LC7/MglB family)
MSVKGTLNELSVADLVQFNCQMGVTSRLTIENDSQVAQVYFKNGLVVHTICDEKEGKEAFSELLRWQGGNFDLEQNVPSPAQTITCHWSDLLLSGLHQLDEDGGKELSSESWFLDSKQDIGDLFGFEQASESSEKDHLDDAEEPDTPAVRMKKPQFKEKNGMGIKRRSDVLAELLDNLLSASADINGAVVVGRDGLVMASNLTKAGHEASRVGAEGAALLGLSTRTLENLKCGEFTVVILQGKEGWVIACGAGSKAMVLGLTSANVNIGMALLEMREIGNAVAETLA